MFEVIGLLSFMAIYLFVGSYLSGKYGSLDDYRGSDKTIVFVVQSLCWPITMPMIFGYRFACPEKDK